MISISAAVKFLVYMVVAGLVFWLFWWALGKIDPPQPFRKVAEVVLILLAVLVVIGALLSLVGGQPIFRP